MGSLYKNTHNYLDQIEEDSVIVEIGSDRGEGSTLYFAELAKKYNTVLHTVDILDTAMQAINHQSIKWHIARGSDWAKTDYSNIAKKISILYLDNFDYIWDISLKDSSAQSVWNEEIFLNTRGENWPKEYCEYHQLPDWVREEIETQFNISYDNMISQMTSDYQLHGQRLSNEECQLEHFKQIYYLLPWLADNCVVVFDDTFKHNGCWIGKNGPGVLLLQSNGFEIVYEGSQWNQSPDPIVGAGVILKRTN